MLHSPPPPSNQVCPAVANGSSGRRSCRWNDLHQLWWTVMITNNEDKKLHLTILMLVGAMKLTMVQLWKGWGSTSDSQYPVMPNNLQVGWRFRHWGWWWLKNLSIFQYVEMPIVARPDCQADYSEVNHNTISTFGSMSYKFCFFKIGGRDAIPVEKQFDLDPH